MNRRGFIGLALGSVAAMVAKPLKAFSERKPAAAIPGERIFRCGSGEMGMLYWSKPPAAPEYVWAILEKMKADSMEKSGVPVSNPRTNYRLTGFKG